MTKHLCYNFVIFNRSSTSLAKPEQDDQVFSAAIRFSAAGTIATLGLDPRSSQPTLSSCLDHDDFGSNEPFRSRRLERSTSAISMFRKIDIDVTNAMDFKSSARSRAENLSPFPNPLGWRRDPDRIAEAAFETMGCARNIRRRSAEPAYRIHLHCAARALHRRERDDVRLALRKNLGDKPACFTSTT
jgi:hypothetical protein